uniref:Uncharacterized protein n=1 Tax=Oryza brachyantha TaxID=4533 RepID=J3MXD7_ORYBR
HLKQTSEKYRLSCLSGSDNICEIVTEKSDNTCICLCITGSHINMNSRFTSAAKNKKNQNRDGSEMKKGKKHQRDSHYRLQSIIPIPETERVLMSLSCSHHLHASSHGNPPKKNP